MKAVVVTKAFEHWDDSIYGEINVSIPKLIKKGNAAYGNFEDGNPAFKG